MTSSKPKKILLVLALSTVGIIAQADDTPIATDFMLMNNYNVRQSADIWERMRQGFRINFPETSKVRYYEKLYTKNKTSFNKTMQNASIYLYYILSVVERYGLPSELALIPIVESNYDTFAINSTGRYDGIWQFIPSTGASFGLNEDRNINERRNVAKATDAAMLYFNSLYLMFGQWDVAIGAYNWGPGNMYKAVLNSNQRLGQVDYTSLPLREITANYVPKLIALANIIKDPQRFGVKLIETPNQPVFAITYPEKEISVVNILHDSNTKWQTFKTLNSQYKNDSYTLTSQSMVILPIPNQNIYLASINNTAPNKLDNNIQLTANSNISQTTDNLIDEPNDTINQIGYSNNPDQNIQNAVSVSYKPANEVNLIIPKLATEPTPTPDKASDTLAEPDDSQAEINQLVNTIGETNDANKHKPAVGAHKKTHYRVAKGDTLYSISKRFDVELARLKHINHIKSNEVKIGQLLVVN